MHNTTYRLVNQDSALAFWINRLHLRGGALANYPFGDGHAFADLNARRSDLRARDG